MTQKVEFEATLKGNGADKLLTTVVKLEQEVRDLKAAFANMGVDADKALGKTTTGLQRTKAAFEKYNGFFFTSLAQQQTARNRDLDNFKARTLAANAEVVESERKALRAKRLARKAELEAEIIGAAKTRSRLSMENLREATEEQKALRAKRLARRDELLRERTQNEDMVRDYRRLVMTKKEIALEDARASLALARQLKADNKLTPDEYRHVTRGIRRKYEDDTGKTAADRKLIRDEERQRQSDQQAGIRLVEQHATAQERFNFRIARATQLKKDQHISEAVFNREVAAANKELNSQFNVLGAIGGQVAGLAVSYLGVHALVGGITERVSRWREETEKLRKASNVSSDTVELLRKRFQVQGGMGDDDAKKASLRINAIANKTALPLSQTYDLATALQTSGFSAEEASGASLETLAKFMQAQGLSPEESNPKEFAQSFAKFLNANEMKPTNANLSKFAKFFQSAEVKKTMIKIPDLLYAASEASGLKEFGVSAETQASLAAFMSDKKRVRVGETNLREVVGHMRTAAGSPDKVAALAELGLRPEDIDMVGEDFYAAMGKVNAGINRMPETKRGVLLEKLFERANVGTAGTVMRNLDHIKAMEQRGFADQTSLDADAAEMTTGRTAANVRGANTAMIEEAKRGSYADQYRKAIETVGKRKGMSGGALGEQLDWYDTYLKRGMTPEAAFARSQGGYKIGIDVLGSATGRSGESYSPEEFSSYQPENAIRPISGLIYGPDRRPTRGEVEAEFTSNAGGSAEAAEMREAFNQFREDMKNNTVAMEKNTEAILNVGVNPRVQNNKQPVAPRAAAALTVRPSGVSVRDVPSWLGGGGGRR